MNALIQLLAGLVKYAAVLVINLSLFLIIPMSHSFFELFQSEKPRKAARKKMVAEYIKPKEKEAKPQPKSRIRDVANATSQPLQDPMKFNFSPDLSVEGGAQGVAIGGGELKAEVFEEGEVDVPAAPTYQPQPDYPERARDLAVEGDVAVTFVVGVDGRVASIEHIEAPHPSFNSAVRKTVSSWKFKPARNKGVPVKSKMSIVIGFQLQS